MPRTKIVLIGGGQIGSTIALMSTQRELGDIVILDLPHNIDHVKGKALDIGALRSNDGVDINLTATSDYADIRGADVIVVTAGISRRPNMTREDLLAINLEVIKSVAKQVKEYAPYAFVIIATNPVDTMTYIFHQISGMPKNMTVGLSGALDTTRFQILIAKETGLSVKDVSCLVLGGHGPMMLPMPRTATVAGIPISNLLSQQQIDSIVSRTKKAGTKIVNLLGNGSAYFSSAASIIEMIEAYLGDKKRVIPSSAKCEGEYGINGYFVGVPCVIGASGVEKIIEIELTGEERAMMEKTCNAVKKSISHAEELKGSSRVIYS